MFIVGGIMLKFDIVECGYQDWFGWLFLGDCSFYSWIIMFWWLS